LPFTEFHLVQEKGQAMKLGNRVYEVRGRRHETEKRKGRRGVRVSFISLSFTSINKTREYRFVHSHSISYLSFTLPSIKDCNLGSGSLAALPPSGQGRSVNNHFLSFS